MCSGDSNKYRDLYDWADSVDSCIWVVKLTEKMHIVPLRAIVGHAHLVPENSASDWFDCVLLVDDHIDLDTYCNVY